jgi:hypothetical protein
MTVAEITLAASPDKVSICSFAEPMKLDLNVPEGRL